MANRALVIVLGAIGIVLVVSAVAILLFYDGDKLIAIGALTAAAGLVIPGLLSLKQSADNATAIAKNTAITAETHTAVNSRMDELIKTVQALAAAKSQIASTDARAEGVREGREQLLDGDAVLVEAPATIHVVEAP